MTVVNHASYNNFSLILSLPGVLRHHFSLQYQFNIKQRRDENKSIHINYGIMS